MANVFSTATLGLRVDVNQFNKNMSGAARTATQALESMRLSAAAFDDKWAELTSGIKDTKRIISGILISQGFYTLMNGLSMGAAAALDFSMNMETAAVSMEYFVNGTDKAAKSLAFLREMNTFAAETPFRTEDALAMSKYMQAVGISMNSTKAVLQVITDTAAATGATQENLQRIVFALGQMQTKGRIANEEIRQLANANIPIYEILQEELNLTGEEISNIGNYWIDADKAIVAILRGLEKRYDGASERISNTVSGMTDTIIDDLKIIAQQAGSGVYDALASNLTSIRDALDRYRDIATEQGSMGLFNQILIDLDASGAVGERILALIGNARQLGTQLRGLYLSARPLIDVFGTGLYASISTAGMTLSSFISIANNAVHVLNDLGITSGTTGQVLASLYVAYKVSTWLGSMGQAAAAAGYQLYSMGTATMAILPASLQAHKGLTLLTTGLAGLITYGLTAYGVFRMLNNAFAGLDTSKTNGNIFPDDYAAALKEYQRQMAEYNEAIKKYQQDFNAPYTAVDDGVDKATSDLEKLEKKNKKTASAFKNDWVASFDEVYSIPDQKGDFGGAGDGPKPPDLPDFGSLLTLPEVKFPTIDQLLPEMPEFPWDKVYGDGLMDADVMDGDWWKALLPFVAAGAALQLGKIMSKNHADAKATTVNSADDVRKAVELGADDLRKVYKETLYKYDEAEALLRKNLLELRNPKNTAELQGALSRNLDRLVDSAEKTVNRLDEVQDALKLTGGSRRDVSVFALAQQQARLNKLTKNIDDIAALQQKLADSAVASSATGEAIRKEIKALRDDTLHSYIKYAGKYGADELVEDLARTINLSMPSLANNMEDLGKSLSTLVDMAGDGFKNVGAASELLGSTKKLLGTISEQYDALNITADAVNKMQGQLGIISKAVSARQAASLNADMLEALRAALDNKEAFKESTGVLGLELKRLDEIASDIRKVAGESDVTAGALTKAVQLFDEMRYASVTAAQAQLDINKAFNKNWGKLLTGYLPEALGALQRVEMLGGAGLLKQFADGNNLLRSISSKLDVAITSAANNAQILPVLKALKADMEVVIKGTGTGIGLSAKYLPQVVTAIQTAANEAGVEATVAADAIAKLTEAVSNSVSKTNTKAIENYLAALRKPAPPKIAQDRFGVKLADASIDIAESAKSIEQAVDKFYAAAEQLVQEAAITQGISTREATTKYNKIIDESLDELRTSFYDINFRRDVQTRGISQDAFQAAMSKIGADVRALPDSQADVLLKGVRSTAYDVLDSLAASRSAEWAGFVRTLKEGGVFDIRKALATGGDMGALYAGQAAFGATPGKVLIQNLLAGTPLAAALRTPPGSAVNAVARFTGNEAEMPALRILSEYLAENNQVLYKTSTYVDEARKVMVQLDGAIGDLNGAQYPVDTKVLASSSYNKIMSVLEQVADIDGRTIKVSAEGFEKFLKVVPEYALQIAAQAEVLGTNTAALAIFDHQVAGLLSTLEDVSDINIATRTGENVLKSRIREAIAEALSDSTTKKTFMDTMRLVEFEIPASAKSTVRDLADFLRWSETTISEIARDLKLSTEEMVHLFDVRLASGQSVGAEGVFRYIGKNFAWANNAPGAVNQLIRSLEPLLKSGRTEYVAEGVHRLDEIKDTLRAALDTAKQSNKLTDEIVVQLHTNKISGAVQEVRMTGDEILGVVKNIDEYQKVISGYQYALTTQANDFIRQLSEAKALGKQLTDVAYTTMKNGVAVPHTVEEILRKAITSAKQLEKIYGVTDKKLSSQLASMLDMGRLVDINNPYKVANIYELTEILEDFKDGTRMLAAASTDIPKAVRDVASGAAVNVTDEVAATVEALEAGAKAQLDTADAVKRVIAQGAQVGNYAAESTVTAAKEAAAAAEEATENAAKAAASSATAANAAKGATEAASKITSDTFKAGNTLLNTDELLKVFQEVKFDPSKTYTVLRKEGAGIGETVSKISGKRLTEMQELGRTGLTQATILDEYGKIAYEPAVQLGEAVTDFAKLLSFASADDGLKLANLLGVDEFLKFSNTFMDELVGKLFKDAGKTQTVVFSETIGSFMDDFFSSVSDADFDAVTKVISEAYSGVGNNFVKNLDLLLDGGLNPKLAGEVTKYLDDVIGDGLGITAEEIGRQLSKSSTLLGHKVTKKYADEITLAAEDALEQASKQVADALHAVTPEITLSDDIVDALSEVEDLGKAVSKGTKTVGKGIKASDLIFGGAAGVGILDILGIGLEGYFASGDAKTINNIVASSIQQDDTLASALNKLDKAGVSLGDLASTGDGFLHTLKGWFGAGDLTNAAYSSVGVEVGNTGAGALTALGVGALSTAAWPAALAGAIVSAGSSLLYGLTGGDTVGNQYSDAYIKALKDDTIYKNALAAGLTEKEARQVSDKELALYGDLILSDLDTGFWKGDDLKKFLYGQIDGYEQATGRLTGPSNYATQNRLMRLMQALGDKDIYTVEWSGGSKTPIDYSSGGSASSERGKTWYKMYEDSQALGLNDVLYQTGNLKGMVQVLDYIFKGANYDSDIAREFFKNYGAEELRYLSTTEYGSYMEAYENAEEFVSMLNELGVLNTDLQTFIEQGQLAGVIQAAVNFKDDANASVAAMLDVFKQFSAPVSGIDGAYVQKQASWISSDDDMADDQAGQAMLRVFNGMSKEVTDMLLEEYGIAVNAQVKEFENSSGQLVSELYTAVQLDKAKLQDDIVGWTVELPDNISLDGASLSANDIEVLAQAGIQINSDGTVSFMKALNENTTGTAREASLTAADLSKYVLDALAGSGVAVNAGEKNSGVKLDAATIAGNMSSAMFRSTLSSGEVSKAMMDALSGLGRVLDSGYVEITNKAVLNGEMTIAEYIDSMGSAADKLSPEVRDALLRIDAVIAQGGEASARAVAEWADGISIKSPISADELTPEIQAAFKEIGISFAYEGDRLMMVINRLGDNLKDGMTLIPEDVWNSLNESVKIGLRELGVTWSTEAGMVKVDISNTLGSLVNANDITPNITAAFEQLGYTFSYSGDRIVGILDEKGNLVTDSLLKIPEAVYNTIDPAVIAALEELGADITVAGGQAMLDLSALMSTGVGNVVATFVEQPELWNQIPEQVKATLVQAGIVAEDGLLKINSKTISGLQPIGEKWVGFWENMPSATRESFQRAGINTDQGLFTIEKYLDETSIPAGVDAIIRKFDELPPEMKDAILASGEAINDNGYVIYEATADAVLNMEEAIVQNKDGAITAARTMAEEIGKAVSEAIASAAQLENLSSRAKTIANKGIFRWGETTDTGTSATYNKEGYTVFKTFSSSGSHSGYVVFKNASGEGKRLSKSEFEKFHGFASGGITTDGLTLVGEQGRELAVLPSGKIVMLGADGHGELTDLPEGTRILNNEDTEQVMKYASSQSTLSAYADGNADVVISGDAGAEAGNSSTATLIAFAQAMLDAYNASTVQGEHARVDEIRAATEAIALAIRGAVASLTEFYGARWSEQHSDIAGATDTIVAAIKDGSSTISSVVSDALTTIQTSISSVSSQRPATKEPYDWRKVVAEAADDWAKAATDAEREAAHQKAEEARATQGFSGGQDGSQYIVLTPEQQSEILGRTTIRANAYGGVATGDQLVRVGEFGRSEAILPLEQPSVMAGVGDAIAAYITPSTGITAKDLDSAVQALSEACTIALRGAVAAVTENQANHSTELGNRVAEIIGVVTQNLGKLEVLDSLSTSVNNLGNVADAIAELRDTFDKTNVSIGGLPSALSAEVVTALTAQIAQAGVDYGNAATADERRLAHNTAEEARKLLGYSGGSDGSGYIPLNGSNIFAVQSDVLQSIADNFTTLFNAQLDEVKLQLTTVVKNQDTAVTTLTAQLAGSKNEIVAELQAGSITVANAVGSYVNWSQNTISSLQQQVSALRSALSSARTVKGSASGSLITRDALYRAGEFGLNEAIIPLERPDVLRQVGSAIASFMPPERLQLTAVAGLQNAGVTVQPPAPPTQDPRFTADALAQRVLETVLPQIAFAAAGNADDDNKRPLFVGTLIADEQGLKTLERKLYDIRQLEATRR